MRFEILTLFPGFFQGPFSESIIKRAADAGLLDISILDIRDYTMDKHRVADDYPYGGGGGMVMKPEPVQRAVTALKEQAPKLHVVFVTPQGKPFDQAAAIDLSRKKHVAILCGHYEGVDERIRDLYVDEEFSIGDYVLTGGETAALVIVEAVSRMIPGVLGNEDSYRNDSFFQGILDFPHYTRPESFEGVRVPEVLLSGHHKNIEDWRRKKALERTLKVRPELLEKTPLTDEDRKILEELRKETQSDESGK